ncbi:hypothetical protein [Rhodoblastus sp.]|uniref:hypothetical protein n=1 Tax=Rhodoblastus sp. TaxID=1962975 RepID=UPI0025F8E408|nr:hypothetical protein [Rhodoblastus sp.]
MSLTALDMMPPDGWRLASIFLVVFLLNVLPAFAPPTWTALSAFSVGAPDINWFALALTGATAATSGRIVLAKLSRLILRGRLLREDSRRNIDEIRLKIEAHRAVSAVALMVFALGPLPSNHLFVAYGLSSLNIAFAAAPFFFGRLTSYSFWILSAAAAGRKFDLDAGDAVLGFGIYFFVSQLLIVPFMYFFVKIDWKELFHRRRLALRRTPKS